MLRPHGNKPQNSAHSHLFVCTEGHVNLLRNTFGHMPRKANDDCLQELR
jgi:hypothetical protein